jgi:hypothetical protein
MGRSSEDSVAIEPVSLRVYTGDWGGTLCAMLVFVGDTGITFLLGFFWVGVAVNGAGDFWFCQL